jgi:hypothetical protein
MKSLFLVLFAAAAGCDAFAMDEPICYKTGCKVSHDAVDQQAEAEAIVWNQVYGRTDKAPGVTWVSQGDCPDDPAQFSVYSGGCALGIYRPAEGQVWAGTVKDQWGTYAHEMLHAALDREDGSGHGDPDHTDPRWKTLLPQATQDLHDAGFQVEVQ